MKGELHVDWIHDEDCPAYGLSVLDPRWQDRHEICQCGMPSSFELSVLHEASTDLWEKRVKAGEADRGTLAAPFSAEGIG